MQEQDTLLDDVHDTVVRIGAMLRAAVASSVPAALLYTGAAAHAGGVSSNINEELATHVDLLDDIESGIGENDTLVTSITAKARDVVDLAGAGPRPAARALRHSRSPHSPCATLAPPGGPQYTCLICSLFGTLVFLIVYALLFKS